MLDSQIVALYWQREESAIVATQEKYEQYLSKIAYNILSDWEDSQESVNDTYMAAWNSMPPHKPDVLSAYLGKLTRRISIDLFRKRSRLKRQTSQYAISLSELEDCAVAGPSPEDTMQTQILAEAINRFLRTLSEDARNLFIGRYYYMDPLKEVAAYCGIGEGRAKSILYRTRCSLKVYLQKEGFDV